jgi:Fe2+ or Zn2+ uptake regulation protein
MTASRNELWELAQTIFVPGEQLTAKTLAKFLSVSIDTSRRALSTWVAQGKLTKVSVNGTLSVYFLANSIVPHFNPYDPKKIAAAIKEKKKEKDRIRHKANSDKKRADNKRIKEQEQHRNLKEEKYIKALKEQEREEGLTGITKEDLQWMKESREQREIKKQRITRI